MRSLVYSPSHIRAHNRHPHNHHKHIPHASSSQQQDIQSLQLHTDIPISIQHISINTSDTTLPLIVADVDAVMQMYIDGDQGDRDPYWTIPWPSSIAMAQELLSHRADIVKNKRIADLGCGLGVGGVAAALAQAHHVAFLDREPLALQCACVNAYMNGFEIEKESNHAAYGGVQALLDGIGTKSLPDEVSQVLKLSREEKKERILTEISSHVFDWSQPVSIKPFDVVLACDVLYESFSVEPVAEVVPKLLKFNTGRLILADPPLRTKYNRDRFVELLQREDFVVEEYTERVVKVWDEEKSCMKDTPITFMIFKRSAFGDTVGVKHFS